MRSRPRTPLIVLMEDPIIHTADHPVCDDPTCICAQEEYEQLRAETARPPRKPGRRRLIESKPGPLPASSSGARSFRLLR